MYVASIITEKDLTVMSDQLEDLNGQAFYLFWGFVHINLYHSNLHPCKDDYRKEQTVNFNDKNSWIHRQRSKFTLQHCHSNNSYCINDYMRANLNIYN